MRLHGDPAAAFVTWGGEFRDLPVLRRCATEHGLLLPDAVAQPLAACIRTR